jgi:hypothetical protein
MIFPEGLLAIVIGFMVLANRLVAMLITPIFDKYEWDKFWLMYVAWVFSGALVFLADVNLFAEFIPNILIGKLLTSIIAGGGANLLHDLTDQGSAIVMMLPDEE